MKHPALCFYTIHNDRMSTTNGPPQWNIKISRCVKPAGGAYCLQHILRASIHTRLYLSSNIIM